MEAAMNVRGSYTLGAATRFQLRDWFFVIVALMMLSLSVVAANATAVIPDQAAEGFRSSDGAIGVSVTLVALEAEGSSARYVGLRVDGVASEIRYRGSHRFEPGDILTGINGMRFGGVEVARRFSMSLIPGSNAEIEVKRGDVQVTIPLTVSRRSALTFMGHTTTTAADQRLESCVISGAGTALLTLLPGLVMIFVDGGVTFAASLPKAIVGGTAACVAFGSSRAIAQSLKPTEGARLWENRF